jgi:hypothetical protein
MLLWRIRRQDPNSSCSEGSVGRIGRIQIQVALGYIDAAGIKYNDILTAKERMPIRTRNSDSDITRSSGSYNHLLEVFQYDNKKRLGINTDGGYVIADLGCVYRQRVLYLTTLSS